ncbi:hypothetical protein [Nocardia sp. N2S4-5]|uniref:hypothetical protein n=1 Tax=Nocardia sp. N2S4-5 TaxID=3351565 RepID=UPI0037D738D5
MIKKPTHEHGSRAVNSLTRVSLPRPCCYGEEQGDQGQAGHSQTPKKSLLDIAVDLDIAIAEES